MTKPIDPSRVHAHRGASAVAPENTLAAFRAAGAAGAGWVEFDVTLLSDGEVAVFHDPTLDRCTDRKGPVQALNGADLAQVDAGSKFGAGFAGEPIPSLRAALECLRETGLGGNLEIKRHLTDSDIGPTVAAVHAHLRDFADVPMMVSSFSIEALRRLRALDPDLELAVLWVHFPPDWREVLAGLGSKQVHLHYKGATPEVLTIARKAGVAIRVWTCDDPSEIADLWDLGLDAVITNDPARFLA